MLSVTIGNKEVPVYGLRAEEAIQSTLFAQWVDSLDPSFVIRVIHIHYVDIIHSGGHPRVLFIKLHAEVETDSGDEVPGIVFLRGGSVGVLLVIRCEGEEYTILTLQPRFPAGLSVFPEIPAGMLDGSGNFSGVAAREIEEETGIVISSENMIDLTHLVYQSRFRGVFPSAGGSDEFLRLFVSIVEMDRSSLDALQGKVTGVIAEGEKIALQVIPLRDLVFHAPDAKALSALTLYTFLKEKNAL